MSYQMEILENGSAQDQMNERAAAGWRLVSVVVHPFATTHGEPQYVSFWEHD